MLGLSVIILFNLIFNVNSNLAESSANCSGLFIVTNHYNCLFRTCRINAGIETSPSLQLALDSARFEFTLKMRLNRI